MDFKLHLSDFLGVSDSIFCNSHFDLYICAINSKLHWKIFKLYVFKSMQPNVTGFDKNLILSRWLAQEDHFHTMMMRIEYWLLLLNITIEDKYRVHIKTLYSIKNVQLHLCN